jgi:hypothetical protein
LRAAFMGLGMVFQALRIPGLVVMFGRLGSALGILGGGALRALLPLVARLAPLFLRFLGPVGLAITAIFLLVRYWPQISSFLGKVRDGFVGLIQRVLGWVGRLFKTKAPAGSTVGSGAQTDGQGNVVRGPLRFYGGGAPMGANALAGLGPESRRRYIRPDGSVSNVEIRTRSPYVRGRAHQGPNGGGGDVYMDGRKVGDVVAGHLSKAIGQTRVGVARHDPRATPAAPAGGYSR